jgi:hypothetical protein
LFEGVFGKLTMMSTATGYKALYEQSQVRIIAQEQQLLQLQRMIFGPRQEGFVPTDPSHRLGI